MASAARLIYRILADKDNVLTLAMLSTYTILHLWNSLQSHQTCEIEVLLRSLDTSAAHTSLRLQNEA